MATACENEDDVPPLEDLSEVIAQVKKLRNIEENGDIKKENDNTQQSVENNKQGSESHKHAAKKGSETFGGFQKGFLNQKPTHQKPTHQKDKPKETEAEPLPSSKEDPIPTIHSKDSTNNLLIPEVQEAMKSSFLKNTDWITEDLLQKLEGRPDLLQKLTDPKYSQALSVLSKSPEEGQKLFQHSKELQEFVKEICEILGEHFTTMAEQTNSQVDGRASLPASTASQDEQKMAEILSDPKTLDVLKDPWISKLIKNLKENPPEARRMLATSRPEVLPKIKKLIDAGILSYG